jgi:transcriptional regulator with XRE-family HTH domain
MNNMYRFDEDCRLIRELRGQTQTELSDKLGIGIATLSRWEANRSEPSADSLEKLYSYAYRSGIRLNRIKEQFYREELGQERKLLFHGAKAVLEGSVRNDVSRQNNDFGYGFYMGESFRQAALFVSNFNKESCVYCLSLDEKGLVRADYSVDNEWMLAIACFRGRLDGRVSEEKKELICSRALQADYIIAPIADNRMYQIIDSFIDGEITDEQCKHALAATELGMQYVLKSKRAVNQAEVLERCFLCTREKEEYINTRAKDISAAEDKVRAARIKYRGKGKYIDELL